MKCFAKLENDEGLQIHLKPTEDGRAVVIAGRPAQGELFPSKWRRIGITNDPALYLANLVGQGWNCFEFGDMECETESQPLKNA